MNLNSNLLFHIIKVLFLLIKIHINLLCNFYLQQNDLKFLLPFYLLFFLIKFLFKKVELIFFKNMKKKLFFFIKYDKKIIFNFNFKVY